MLNELSSVCSWDKAICFMILARLRKCLDSLRVLLSTAIFATNWGTVTIIDLLHIIRKRIAYVITAFAVIIVAVIGYLVVAPRTYQATADTFTAYASADGKSLDTDTLNTGTAYLTTQIKSYPALASHRRCSARWSVRYRYL